MKKYSVLMSVYDKENPKHFQESIESMLNQTLKPDEIVIVEDGILTESLELVIKEYKEKYQELFHIVKFEKHVGLGKSLRTGILECKNEYIARMDTDDISEKSRCEKQINEFEKNPKLDIVGSKIAEFNNSIENITRYNTVPETNDEIYKYGQKRSPVAHGSVIMKKSKVLEAGNYTNEFSYFEDYDLWIRMMKNKCQFYNIQEALVFFRVDDNLYKRRGGIKYLKAMIKFKTEQYRNGFFSLWNYLLTVTIHSLVCIVPNKVRKYIYRTFLRSKKNDNMLKG